MLETLLVGYMSTTIRTPKYSCRDCWTGGYPMKNDQQEPELKPLWGLTKKLLSNKSKEKRILEMVNRMITRIQNDERKYLWRNTHTKPVCDYQKSSKMRCPTSATSIKSITQTWWDVRYLNSFRLTLTIQKTMGSWCSSDEAEVDQTLRFVSFNFNHCRCSL